MKIAVFASNMNFFQEIYKEICKIHDVRLFEEPVVDIPIGRRMVRNSLRKRRIKSLMKWADVSFFEWADQYLVEATKLPKKQSKIVTRLHSYELATFANNVNWKNVDKVILISKAMKSRFTHKFPDIEPEKTIVIDNIIDLAKFHIPENKDIQMNLGILTNVTPIKRIYDLILAFSEINKEMPNLRLFVGGGESQTEKRYPLALQELIIKLRLQDKVILEGRITDTPNWFHKIDIYISHSWWEGFSVSLLEAMASGCYPLVHFWNGAEEIIPTENIYIQNYELQDKVIEYYSLDEDQMIEHSKKIRNIIEEKFSDNKQLKEIINLIENM